MYLTSTHASSSFLHSSSALHSLFDSPAVTPHNSPLDAIALNPQPLPPRDPGMARFSGASHFDAVALNPQPLPPGDPGKLALSSVFSRFDAVALNPQPLPPRESGAAAYQPSWVASIEAALTSHLGRF